MKFTDKEIAEFIELVTEDKGVVIQHIKKDVVSYIHSNTERKFTKNNLHSLAVTALSLLSKKYGIVIKINNGVSIFKIEKFKFEADIKEWTNSVIFITLLKLK